MGRQGKKWRHSDLYTGILAFALPIWVMLAVYNASFVYPFGDQSVLWLDLNSQYLPLFSEMMRSVKTGGGLFYTWNAGLGSNLWVIYGCNLASPFFWLGLLIPEQYNLEFLTYLTVFKTGLCGLAAYSYFYLRDCTVDRGQEDRADYPGKDVDLYRGCWALFFALGYALSGYLAAYSWNIMWLDNIAVLPIILLGLERMVWKGKPFLYCISLAFSILTNFYISIMICIFLFLYFVFLLCMKHTWKAVFHFVGFSLIAGGIAGVILMPELFTILSQVRNSSDLSQNTGQYFAMWDAFLRHCALAVPDTGGKWPNIFCGVAVFLFVPLYAVNERISMRRRVGMLALSGFMLLSFATPALEWLWHGMSYPHGLPGRQAFCYILLMLAIGCESARSLDINRLGQRKKLLYVYLVAVAFLLLAGREYRSDLMTGAVAVTILFLTVYAIGIYELFLPRERRTKAALLSCMIAVELLELLINMQATGLFGSMERAAYSEGSAQVREFYDQTKAQESGLYRMERIDREHSNEGVKFGIPSASIFSSVLNHRVKAMYDALGMQGFDQAYYVDGSTPFTEALLNIKYLYGKNSKFANNIYHELGAKGDWRLYHNEAEIPFGYVAPSGYELTQDRREDAIQKQNRLVYDLGLEDELFWLCVEESGKAPIHFTAQQDGMYYGILVDADVKENLTLTISQGRNYSLLRQGSVFYIGNLKRDDVMAVAIKYGEEEIGSATIRIYRLNEVALQKAVEKLSEQHLENVVYDNSHISGKLKLEQAGRLILSVPYEKGWQVTLNGEKVEPVLFGGALIAFDLEAGEYELEMSYIPYGLRAGIVISIFSAAILVALWFAEKHRRRVMAMAEG